MKPTTFVTRPSFVVVGLKYRGKNKHNEIPKLWDTFFAGPADKITGKLNPKTSYGVEDNFDAETGKFDYVACYEVGPDAPVPDGMVRWEIPERTYAVFKGTLSKIKQMYNAAYNEWLAKSDYRRDPGPEFEFYDEDFAPCKGKETMYLYLPVVKR